MTVDLYANIPEATFAVFGDAKPASPNEITQLTLCLTAACRQIDNFTDRPDGFGKPTQQTARRFIPESWDWVWVDDIADANEAAITVKTDPNNTGLFDVTWVAADFQLEPLNAHVKNEGRPYTGIRAVWSKLFPPDYGAGGIVAGGVRLTTPDAPIGLSAHRNAVVEVTATWGWPNIPTPIHDAALQQTIYLYKSYGAPFGIAGAGDMGEVRMLGDRLHPTARSLCADYMRNQGGLS